MFFAYSLVIGCSLMHIFCCAVPITLAILGLGATLGLAQTSIVEGSLFQSFERFELEILLISGVILSVLFIIKNRSKELKCCPSTQKKVCDKSEKLSNIFLKVSVVLYAFSLTNYTIGHLL